MEIMIARLVCPPARVGAEKGARGRAEGVEVILDPMGQHFADDLQEHIDRIRSSPLAAPGVRGAAPSVPPPKKIFFSKFPLAGEAQIWYHNRETWKRSSLCGRRAGDPMQMQANQSQENKGTKT
jgi:hypothetical protein